MPTEVNVRSLLAAVALDAVASAQMAEQIPLGEAQGQFTNWAVGMSLFDPAFAASSDAARIRAPGVQNGQPIAWSASVFGAATAVHPDYSIGKLTQNWGVSLPSAVPLFGGISTGGDVTPVVDGEGVLQRSPRVWYGLNISVRPDAQGHLGSLIRSRAEHPDGAGSDVFSYYPYAGLALPQSFENTVRVELTRAQLGLAPATATQLDNLDLGMGVIAVDPQGDAGFFAPVRDRFYFSITKQALLSAGSWPAWDGQPVHPSTIYRMEWDGSSWSAPSIAYASSALLPDRSDVGTAPSSPEIDALSVYETSGHDRVVFSLTLASDVEGAPYDQILVHQRSPTSCATLPLQMQRTVDPVPVRVSDRFGLRQTAGPGGGPDDVDGTCGVDPRLSENPTLPIATRLLGVAAEDHPLGTGLGLSHVRTRLPDIVSKDVLVDTVFINVSGLRIEEPDCGFVSLYLHEDDGFTLLAGPLFVDAAAIERNCWTIAYTAPPPTSETKPIRISAEFVPVHVDPIEIDPPRRSWVLEMH